MHPTLATPLRICLPSLLALGVLASTGCVAGVFTFGTYETSYVYSRLGPGRNELQPACKDCTPQPRREVIALWGDPSAVTSDGACEVLRYPDGLAWSGFGISLPVPFLPVPLLVLPTGRGANLIYLRNGNVVAVVRTEWDFGKGYGLACAEGCGLEIGSNLSSTPVGWRPVECN